MGKRRLLTTDFEVRVSPAGSGGGGAAFESGWTEFQGGAVVFGAATGSASASPSDYVVQPATLVRTIVPADVPGATNAYLAALLDGSQTTPVDVEIQPVRRFGSTGGRKLTYRVVVLTEYSISTIDASAEGSITERFVFVAKSLAIDPL